MPELPSVEIYKQYFDSTCLYKIIKSLKVRNPEILLDISPLRLSKILVGKKFVSSSRYGKYLFANLEDRYSLVMHFGMTGFLKYFSELEEEPSHSRVLITFQNGYQLAFDDQRKFGRLGLTLSLDEFIQKKRLGPDALEVSFKDFKEIFYRRKGMMKPLLLNQNLIAGIGNLYADEILYQSRIHPLTKADKLDSKHIKNLFKVMKKVLKKAIDYRDDLHTFPDFFLLSHRYTGGECPQGGKIIKMKVGGRTTFFCPECQKEIV
jgi:formamidopyrimidine-DNA glycosylase